MTIYFDEDNTKSSETTSIMEKAFCLALEEEGLDSSKNYCISVSFVGLNEIHKLNKEYRAVDRPTDVLSFPMFEREEIKALSFEDDMELGDVVICLDKAKEQAMEFGHSFERELIYLFVHSVFHLLGYDHEQAEDKAIMRAKEETVMNKLGIVRE